LTNSLHPNPLGIVEKPIFRPAYWRGWKVLKTSFQSVGDYGGLGNHSPMGLGETQGFYEVQTCTSFGFLASQTLFIVIHLCHNIEKVTFGKVTNCRWIWGGSFGDEHFD